MQIKGYFSSMKSANDVVSSLKQAGFSNAALDMNNNEMYSEHKDTWSNLTSTGGAPSLSSLVMEANDSTIDRSKAPAAAANPMVSGMGGFTEIADVSCNVMVDVDDSDASAAQQIITSAGGSLKNPNMKRPRMKEDADINAIESSISNLQNASNTNNNIQ